MDRNKVLEIRKLNKSFKNKKVLNDLDFCIYENEIVGFIGPNGAGKSTTMKCISNLVYPDSGDIIICGFNLKKDRNKSMEYQSSLIENPGMYPDLTGYENLTYFGKLKNVAKEQIDEVARFTGLQDNLNKKTKYYSIGMKQRLGIGIALLGNPKLLVLDEPMNGLDIEGVIEFRDKLKELKDKYGISILLSSHQLDEVEKIADRFIFINKGKVVNVSDRLNEQMVYLIEFDKEINDSSILQNYKEIISANKEGNRIYKIHFMKKTSLHNFMNYVSEKDYHIIDIRKSNFKLEDMYKHIFIEK